MSDDLSALAKAFLGRLDVTPPGTSALLGLSPGQPDTRPVRGLLDYAPPSSSSPLSVWGLPASPTNALLRSSEPPLSSIFGTLAPSSSPQYPAAPTNKLAPVFEPEVARKVYFAFSFDDVMRVNNVRHTGKIGPRVVGRSRGFLDRSIWEKRNIKNEDNLKRLMQQSSKYSSVVCVLIGTDTWESRWVRYEIALSVIDERGLLAVHINTLNFVGGTGPDPLGPNPLHFMGIHRDKNGKHYLVERKIAVLNEATGDVGFRWHWYNDYQLEVPRPRYLPELAIGAIVPLSTGTLTYDYSADAGSRHIASWLDAAAAAVGR